MFQPKFTVTTRITSALLRIEAARVELEHLPITTSVLATLRETARLFSTHYSTMIEGNRLTQEEVSRVVESRRREEAIGHFPGRERDEKEVLGYYVALERAEQIAAREAEVTERQIQMLHALIMSGGGERTNPTPYRDGQNVIRDSVSRTIVYMPPEAKDVSVLMSEMVAWINASQREGVACPIRAAIAHYQLATIHPYYDGNGRTARILTTLILHQGGYGLKGLYSLEEYYARNLPAYYRALTVGPSHNYYMGRAESDITSWIDYFCAGMAESFESVRRRAEEAAASGMPDHSRLLGELDPRQRRVLELFRRQQIVTSQDIALLFSISQRMARVLLAKWVPSGFVVVVDPAKRSRKYALGAGYLHLRR